MSAILVMSATRTHFTYLLSKFPPYAYMHMLDCLGSNSLLCAAMFCLQFILPTPPFVLFQIPLLQILLKPSFPYSTHSTLNPYFHYPQISQPLL